MTLQNATHVLLGNFSLVVLLFAGFGGMAVGQSPANELAIKGYDTVAYFKAGKALKGSESFTFQWHDMTWYFFIQEKTGTCLRPVRRNMHRNMTVIAPGP